MHPGASANFYIPSEFRAKLMASLQILMNKYLIHCLVMEQVSIWVIHYFMRAGILKHIRNRLQLNILSNFMDISSTYSAKIIHNRACILRILLDLKPHMNIDSQKYIAHMFHSHWEQILNHISNIFLLQSCNWNSFWRIQKKYQYNLIRWAHSSSNKKYRRFG